MRTQLLSDVNPGDAEGLNVAAVGRRPLKRRDSSAFSVAVVPEAYVAESLVEGLATGARQAVLLPRAAVARDVIPDALRAAGAEVDVVEAYRNAMPEAAPEQLRAGSCGRIGCGDVYQFFERDTSGGSGAAAGVAWPFAGVPAISIGPITSQSLRELGWPPAEEANPSDIPGLIAAVERVLMNSDYHIRGSLNRMIL